MDSAVVLNCGTYEINGSDNGQINFTLILKDSYILTEILISGEYKSFKYLENNTWHIAKITSNLNITVNKNRLKRKDANNFTG